MMYFCELVNDGIVQDRFFIEGESVKAIKDYLDWFQCPEGEWTITRADSHNWDLIEEDDDEDED